MGYPMTNKSAFVQQIYQVALSAGLTDSAARVMASQAAIESEYGAKPSGDNNFFGIKAGSSWTGPTKTLPTHEVVNGKRIKLPQKFRVYDTPEAGIADRVQFMASKFPAFNSAATVGDALDALQNGKYGKYYTAKQSDYEGAVNHINTAYLGGTPVPPGGMTAVGTQLDTNRVAATQEMLASRGFDPGPIDGKNGPKTKAAVKAFQRANGLVEDGIVGPKTQVALDQTGNSLATLGTEGPHYGRGVLGGMERNSFNLANPAPAQHATGPAPDLQTLAPPPMASLGAPPNALMTLGGGVGAGSSATGSAALAPKIAPPVPVQRPVATSVPTATKPRPASSGGLVRLASGKMVAPGTYQNRDGSTSIVTEGLDGNAVVSVQRSGINLAKEAGAPTLLGGFIRSKIPEALGQAGDNVGNALGETAGTAQRAVVGAAEGVKSNVLGFGSNIGNAFMGLGSSLGFKPAYQPNASGSPDDRDSVARSPSVLAPTPMQRPAITTTYRPVAAKPVVKSNSRVGAGGDGSGGSGGGTFKGSSTGRIYNVGQTYSNASGSYIATGDPGKPFQKVA